MSDRVSLNLMYWLLRPALGGFVWLALFSLAAQIRPLTILHTNDLHSKFQPNYENRGGFAAMATAIKREKANCRACLTLNAGDFVTGSPESTIFKGTPAFEIANLMGFDAAVIGNHEFDHGWDMIPQYVAMSHFPLLLANMQDSHSRPLVQKASQIFKVGGMKVAVIGGLTMDLPNLISPINMGSFKITSLVQTLRARINEVRNDADLIVLLLHITADEEDQLLRELPEAPILITGHVHRGLEAPKVRDGRVLVRARAFGFELGRLDLMVDIQKKKVQSFTWKKIAITPRDFSPDLKVARAVEIWQSRVTDLVDVPIGESKRVYTRPELRILFAEAMKDQMKADFAFINEGAIRDELPKGRVTIRDVYNIMPFNNKILVGTFPGSALPPIIAEGAVIEPARPYRFAIQDFTLWHQRAQLGLDQDLQFPEEGPLFRDLLIQWIRKKGVIQ